MVDVGRHVERAAVERLLAFANLGRVRNEAEVYRLLEGPELRNRLALVRDDGSLLPLYPQRLRETGAEAAAILNSDLAEVDKLLLAIAPPGNAAKARAEHGARIAELVALGALVGIPTFSSGRVRVALEYVSSGVQAACGYGLALIYDRTKPWRIVVRRCGWADCDQWFVAIPRNGGGPRPRYCRPEHQRAADKERAVTRARQWRVKHQRSKS